MTTETIISLEDLYPSERLRTTADAVLAGGRATLLYFGQPIEVLKTRYKFDGTAVTAADNASEAAMIPVVQANHQGEAITAEESGRFTGTDYDWFFDGVDGTFGFRRGEPNYAVIAGSLRRPEGATDQELTADHMETAGICLPAKRLLFLAQAGNGAYMVELGDSLEPIADPRRLKIMSIAPNPQGKYEGTTVVMDAYATEENDIRKTEMYRTMRRMFGTLSTRQFGSNGHDQVITAMTSPSEPTRNMVDGYFADCFSGGWDYMPGALIIKEAGGMMIGPDGNPVNSKTQAAIAGSREFVDLTFSAFSNIYGDYQGFQPKK